MSIKENKIRFQMSSELSGSASFRFYNILTEFEYIISNENNDKNEINYSVWRDGRQFENKYFDSVESLMLFLDNETIEIENFEQYNFHDEN